ncbi:MAG: sel1 repeat family protein [Campylobacterales bacterium]|nr:sel1 repeat family protein [Campylobacterales bacterium]
MKNIYMLVFLAMLISGCSKGLSPEAQTKLDGMEKECFDGNLQTCLSLKKLYEFTRRYSSIDYDKQPAIIDQACKLGDMDSCYTMGVMYFRGCIVGLPRIEPDFQKAIEYSKKACEGGDKFGCMTLGQIYNNGCGVAKDTVKAEEFFKIAERRHIGLFDTTECPTGSCW